MTTTTITFDATSDTDTDAYPSGSVDWAYLAGSGSALQVNAANDNVQVTGFTGLDRRARYIGEATVTGDQDVTATVHVKNSNNAGVLMRCSASADTCYEASIETAQTNEVRLYRVVAGTKTLLASWDDSLGVGNHTIRGRATGSGATVSLEVQVNGGTTHTYSDTDGARLTSGNPGLMGNTDENYVTIDTWILDDLASSNITVNPAAATITFTGGTPTVSTTGNVTVNPAAATLTFTGGTPTITAQNYTWYDLPAPGSYDSNSILAGQTYPTGSWLRVVTDFAHITYNYAAAEAAGELDNDINDHATAEGGYTGNDTATYEIKTPAGSTAQYTITADVQETGISLGPAATTLTFTGGTPTVTIDANITVNPAAAALTLTGGTPTVAGTTVTVNPAAATLVFTGTTPVILNGPLSDSGHMTRRLTGRLTKRLKRA